MDIDKLKVGDFIKYVDNYHYYGEWYGQVAKVIDIVNTDYDPIGILFLDKEYNEELDEDDAWWVEYSEVSKITKEEAMLWILSN